VPCHGGNQLSGLAFDSPKQTALAALSREHISVDLRFLLLSLAFRKRMLSSAISSSAIQIFATSRSENPNTRGQSFGPSGFSAGHDK
jgi:hypothetical protein